jgi:hypothetical protein
MVIDVTNPVTGKTWMDRNLGASQVATSLTDANAYGDLYQWGRLSDGHQCRNSTTTTTRSSGNQPGHGQFIINGNFTQDWLYNPNTSLWQGLNGINNPCPSGYRIPTSAELNSERLTWGSPIAPFASPLKWSYGGSRNGTDPVYGLNGPLNGVGTVGEYWSSTISTAPDDEFSNTLGFQGPFSGAFLATERVIGCSVRCIKN